jgi:uncharacterized OB-fold protein
LYSYSTVWAGPKVFEEELPYTVCVVDLDEGTRRGVACSLLEAVMEETRSGNTVADLLPENRSGHTKVQHPLRSREQE